jgi:hypothetical protein
MRIVADWLDEAPNAAPEERATACDLRIFVGPFNATMHQEHNSKTLVDHVTMPAYSVAEGLAKDWWTIFGGRDREWSLVGHRMGYAVPDVRLTFDGITFTTYAGEQVYKNPPVRFLAAGVDEGTRSEAEKELSSFINKTIERLQSCGSTSLKMQWDRVTSSRLDVEEAAFCEAAGALAVDPYSIEEQDATLIDQAGKLFNGDTLNEFLAGLVPGPARGATVNWIINSEKKSDDLTRLPDLVGLTREVARNTPVKASEKAWAIGYRRARSARRAMHLDTSNKVKNFKRLAKLLGAPQFADQGSVEGLHAVVSTKTDGAHVYLRDLRNEPSAQLFSFGRAVGDAICFPAERRGIVNELHRASRQAAGRAFAAEFLAPIQEVLAMCKDGKDNVSIGSEFGVSSVVISHQIENARRIEEVCAT